jgi:hypothetical protein
MTTDVSQAASLLLKLYELRTEPRLREARHWFTFEFHPHSASDILWTWLGPGHESGPYRMVTTYWDMAASLVVKGAIPADMFNEANTEHFAVVAKLRPYLAEVRATAKYPGYLGNVEHVATIAPEAEAQIAVFARYLDRQRRFAEEGKQRTTYSAGS